MISRVTSLSETDAGALFPAIESCEAASTGTRPHRSYAFSPHGKVSPESTHHPPHSVHNLYALAPLTEAVQLYSLHGPERFETIEKSDKLGRQPYPHHLLVAGRSLRRDELCRRRRRHVEHGILTAVLADVGLAEAAGGEAELP